jgi:hypothetical protein
LSAWAIATAATALHLGPRQRAIAIRIHGTEHGIRHDAQFGQRNLAVEVRINKAQARRLAFIHAFAHGFGRATAFTAAGSIEGADFLKRQAAILIGVNFREARGQPGIGFFARDLAIVVRVSTRKSLTRGEAHHAIATLAVMHLVHLVHGLRRHGLRARLRASEPRRAKGKDRGQH